MSEKQFQIIHLGNPYEFVVKDHTTNKTYGPFEGDEKSMSDLLNNLHQENITLKERRDDFAEENLALTLSLNKLKEELQRFKNYVFSDDTIVCYKCEHCIKKDIYVVDCEMKGKVDVHGLCSLFREVKV